MKNIVDYYNIRFIYKDGEKTITKGLGAITHWEDFEPAFLNFIRSNDAQDYEKLGRALINVEGTEKLSKKVPYCRKELDSTDAAWTFDCINKELIYEPGDRKKEEYRHPRLVWPFAAKGGLKHRKNPFKDIEKAEKEFYAYHQLIHAAKMDIYKDSMWTILVWNVDSDLNWKMKKLGFTDRYEKGQWQKAFETKEEAFSFLKEFGHVKTIQEFQTEEFLDSLSPEEFVSYSNKYKEINGEGWASYYGSTNVFKDYMFLEDFLKLILTKDIEKNLDFTSLTDVFQRIDPEVMEQPFCGIAPNKEGKLCAVVAFKMSAKAILHQIKENDLGDPRLKALLEV